MNNIIEVFDLLIEEIEGLLTLKRDEGAKAYRDGKIDVFQEVDKVVQFLEGLQESVNELRDTTVSFFQMPVGVSKKRADVPKKVRRRRASLDATPKDRYRPLILEILSELGGKAPSKVVERKVEERMQGHFRPDDLRPLDSGEIRWRKRLHWCRHYMVEDGLLRKDSPRGIWEMTDLGRQELQRFRAKRLRA